MESMQLKYSRLNKILADTAYVSEELRIMTQQLLDCVL